MFPIICKIGPFAVYSYGLMLALAVIVCSYLLTRDAARQGISAAFVYDFAFVAVVSGIIGARIFHVALNPQPFIQNPLEIIMLQHGGLAWQGGLIGGTLSSIIFLRRKGQPVLPFADLTAPYIALGQAIGRIGCFFNGCCYGKHAAWGIYFPVHGDTLHPSQLYCSAFLFAIFFILKAYQKKAAVSGRVLMLYFMLAATERFIVEFFRADHTLSVFGWLSEFQMVSIGIFLMAFFANAHLGKSK